MMQIQRLRSEQSGVASLGPKGLSVEAVVSDAKCWGEVQEEADGETSQEHINPSLEFQRYRANKQ